MVHQNNSKNLSDIKTKFVVDIIPTFALRKIMGGVGWGEFISAATRLGSGVSIAGRLGLLVLQNFRSLLDWH